MKKHTLSVSACVCNVDIHIYTCVCVSDRTTMQSLPFLGHIYMYTALCLSALSAFRALAAHRWSL